MIKKVFAGAMLAAVFGLLFIGAVDQAMAKAIDQAPLALSQNLGDNNGGGGNGNRNTQVFQNQILDGGPDDCIGDGQAYGAGSGFRPGNAAGNIKPPLDGTGYGFGVTNPEAGFGWGIGARPEGAPRDGTHAGIADVSEDEWVTVSGVVESVSDTLWVITLEDGTSLEVFGRPLSCLVALGFNVNPGDAVSITGFYNESFFAIGEVSDLTSGESALIRESDGQPLWAGGRRGGKNK